MIQIPKGIVKKRTKKFNFKDLNGLKPGQKTATLGVRKGVRNLSSMFSGIDLSPDKEAKLAKAHKHYVNFITLISSIEQKKMSNQNIKQAEKLYSQRNTIMKNNPYSSSYIEPFEIFKRLHNVDVLAHKYEQHALLNNERSMNATLKEYNRLLKKQNTIVNRQRTLEELRKIKGPTYMHPYNQTIEELESILRKMYTHLFNRDFEKAQNMQMKYKRTYDQLMKKLETIRKKGFTYLYGNVNNNLKFVVTPQKVQEEINAKNFYKALGRKIKANPRKGFEEFRFPKSKTIKPGKKRVGSPKRTAIPLKQKIKVNFSRVRPTYYNAMSPAAANENQFYNAKTNVDPPSKTKNNKKPAKSRMGKALIGAIGALYGSSKFLGNHYAGQPALALPPAPRKSYEFPNFHYRVGTNLTPPMPKYNNLPIGYNSGKQLALPPAPRTFPNYMCAMYPSLPGCK